MLKIGSIIDGKYKVLNKIGQGGMSVVYLAMNERANKQWAIKEVRKDGVKDFEIVKQGLIVETELLKKLRHRNLPSIIDVIDQQDNFLIVMDYIQGNPLSKSLEEYGAQPQDTVIDWARQLCDVLGYLHTRTPAIIYRDMKPSNVMLKPDGDVMLIDFGTAREFKERNIEDTTCLGTIGYAAPEQFGGQGQTDARTDIYCLGATLYHLVTGVSPCAPPYEIKPIRQINPVLSSGLEKIIMKCTQRNPDDRYQSCAELMYALEHYNEIDDLYRRKQKKKLAIFVASVLCTIIAGTVGFVGQKQSVAANDANFENVITEARRTSDELEKRELYIKAIEMKPADVEPYRELIAAYISGNDQNYTLEEESEFKEIMNQHGTVLKRNTEAYVNVSFEAGIAYWYYYNYGKTENTDNQDVRMKAAMPWFENVILNSMEDTFVNWNIAKIYYEIAKFNKDINYQIDTASDKGKYIEYWNNIKEMVEILENNKGENENVKLELYKLFAGAIETYTYKFKNDGVSKEDITDIFETVKNAVSDIDITVGRGTEENKNYIESRYDSIQKNIENTFN